jgi:hypothetical protein
MTGRAWFNYPVFDSARDWLVRMGFEVVSPADVERAAVGFEGLAFPQVEGWFQLRDTVRRCLEEVQGCAGIVLLPEWYQSAGARAELGVARWLGLRVWVLEEDATAPGWVLHPWTGNYVMEAGETKFRHVPGDGEGINAERAEGAELRGEDQGRERAGAACGGGSED